MNDVELLKSYVSTGSQDAFTRLVQRHINLVYSVALRSTRDSHLADDVTQAVFLVLAKKARTIRGPALLPAWLMSTTRYAANNARRGEFRRRHHEHEAAAMLSETYNPPEPGADVSPMLDYSLEALSPADRTAILLRYIHNKTAREIGQDLGISEQTAQRRLSRALEKIRTFLSRRGISRPADAISSSLGQHYLHVAPEALTALIVARCATTAAATATSASALAELTLKTIAWAHAKLLAAACAACLLIAGGVTVAVVESPLLARAEPVRPPATTTVSDSPAPATLASTMPSIPSSQPAATEVLLLPNDGFTPWNNPAYSAAIDPAISRDGGPPVLLLQSATARLTDNGGAMRRVDIKPFLGKRVRFSAYVKCSKLANWGGLFFNSFDNAGQTYTTDDMVGRGITGTRDWTRLEIVSDVSPRATEIGLGVHLCGAGQLWLDGARLEVVGNDVSTTDDRNQHLYSAVASNYSLSVDPATLRNGHPTVCITSATKPTGSWCFYGGNNHTPDPYLGHRIRVTAWIKSEKVTGSARLSVWAWDPQNKLICIDNPAERKHIKAPPIGKNTRSPPKSRRR